MPEGFIPVLFLLALVASCSALANRLPVPEPVLLTLMGIVLAFSPWMPRIELEPGIALTVVLPPLVYAAAVALPWEDFRTNLRPIALLSTGLVMVTISLVAWVAHAVQGFAWAPAFALGAIVSPTDPAASTAVATRAGLPHRLSAILEGEGLMNDAVALTFYSLAVSAIATGTFSIASGVFRFVAVILGEALFGIAVGWVVGKIRSRIFDARIEITVSLLTPFAAFLPAHALGGSGILATLAAGMYIGYQSPEIMPSGTRLHLVNVWDIVVFYLNGILFLLTGLEFRPVLTGATGFPLFQLAAYGAMIAGTVVAARFAWTWAAAYLLNRRDSRPRPNGVAFLSWCGMRGGISLVAALALPPAVPDRGLIIFLTAATITATLLVQGSSLGAVVRILKLDREAREESRRLRRQEIGARIAAAEGALAAVGPENPMRDVFETRIDVLRTLETTEDAGPRRAAALRSLLDAERKQLLRMHREGKIPERVRHRVERDIDLREARLGADILEEL